MCRRDERCLSARLEVFCLYIEELAAGLHRFAVLCLPFFDGFSKMPSRCRCCLWILSLVSASDPSSVSIFKATIGLLRSIPGRFSSLYHFISRCSLGPIPLKKHFLENWTGPVGLIGGRFQWPSSKSASVEMG